MSAEVAPREPTVRHDGFWLCELVGVAARGRQGPGDGADRRPAIGGLLDQAGQAAGEVADAGQNITDTARRAVAHARQSITDTAQGAVTDATNKLAGH
jgi:hypothetical protein